jgi:hypothetical protein
MTVANTGPVTGSETITVEITNQTYRDAEHLTDVEIPAGETITRTVTLTAPGKHVTEAQITVTPNLKQPGHTSQRVHIGSGDEREKTRITTWSEFDAIRENPDDDFLLAADLTPSTDGYRDVVASGNGFTPIGGSNAFTGTFDGDGHTISGLQIDRSGDSTVGVFRFVNTGATIRDVTIDNVTITGSDSVGGVAGRTTNLGDSGDAPVIENVDVTGTVTGTSTVGGVIGEDRGGARITDVTVSGSVTGSERVGGVIGRSKPGFTSDTRGVIRGVKTDAAVTGAAHIGGVIGDNTNTDIRDSLATGRVKYVQPGSAR